MKSKIFLIYLLLTAIVLNAAGGPKYRSLRAYSMGNAHVAVADDKEAIYYNYAGLSQMGKLGNYNMHPEMGYYPHNGMDLKLNAAGMGPVNRAKHIYDLALDLEDLYNDAERDAEKAGTDTEDAFLDSLSAHPEYANKISRYDHLLMTIIAQADLEFAVRNFGAAVWLNATVSPYIDGALVLPYAATDTFYIDAVAQMGGAIPVLDNLSFGLGVKVLKRQVVKVFRTDVSNFENIADTLENRYEESRSDFFSYENIGYGMDFGVLYQATRTLRVGASLRDIFFNEVYDERIRPNLTVGLNYSPRMFNRNTAYARKVNIAFDFEDALDNERGYKPLSHLNAGLEVEQVLAAIPGYESAYRFLKLRLAGGLKGGYPTAGIGLEVLRFFDFEFATWAEERGYYTGQAEERFYMAQVSLGF
ncbi:MAG: hypothetical protein LBR60_02880 [Fibrobacter sp.]|nr:hypothetical protein [Fibrobacter sp.]